MFIDFRERRREGRREVERKRESGRERHRQTETERNTDVREKHPLDASHTALPWIGTHNLRIYPGLKLNLQYYGAWDNTPNN